MRILPALTLIALVWSTPAAGQTPPALDSIARVAAADWQRQDPASLVRESPQLVVQLPGADPSAAVSREQAVVLLKEFLAGAVEISTEPADVRELTPGRGLVELRRHYRVRGTQDVREQRILLSYRLGGKDWILVELRVTR